MKTYTPKEMLLLRQSGELSPEDEQKLDALLTSEAKWREEERSLNAIRDTWKQATQQTPAPSEKTLQRTRLAARNGATAKGRLIAFPLPVIRIAMAAAITVIAFGATLFITHAPSQPDPPTQGTPMTPVDAEIADALEAFDASMMALLDVEADETALLNDNDS